MKEKNKQQLKKEAENLSLLNEKGFSAYSKALQLEILDFKNRKFKEFLIGILEDDGEPEDRSVILKELGKKNSMFKLFKEDTLMVILAAEQGINPQFRKYLYTKTNLSILEISAIINENVTILDREITSKKWKRQKKLINVDYILLRSIIISGGKAQEFSDALIIDPDEIRKPFRSLLAIVTKEIQLRLSRTAITNASDVDNLFTLTKVIEKTMALSLEAHGDIPNIEKERNKRRDDMIQLKKEELRLNTLGGTIMTINSFSETNQIAPEEMLMIVKDILTPYIVEEKLQIADDEVKRLIYKLNGEDHEPN